MAFNREDAKRQLEYLEEEQRQAKLRVIEAGFDCTTSVYAIVKQYRDSIKKYCEILRMNAYDDLTGH